MKTWIPDARNFAYLTWKQVDALPRESTLLVLPTAAIEQHGHHLPLATDTLINNLLLGKALDLLPGDLPIYALPPVCYGKSNEHIGFPGTLSVSAQTFLSVVRDLGASIAASGFKKVVLYNTHAPSRSSALLARPSKVSVHRSAPMASMPVRSKPPFCSMPRPLWSIRMNTPRTTLPASISLNC